MTASAVHKLSGYCVQWSVYCLTRIYNPGTSLALRFLCSWLNAGANTCVLGAEDVINRASELWKSGKSQKWQSIRNYAWNKKFSTKFDDLGVIITRKRCSIQQGEKDNCWSEQSPEKLTVSTVLFFFFFFWGGGGGTRYIYLGPVA